jgi:hypothetical protein
LIAGIVLVAVSAILAVVIAGVSWRAYTTIPEKTSSASAIEESTDPDTHPRAHNNHHHHSLPIPTSSPKRAVPSWTPFLTHPTRLLIVLGTGLLVFTELLAVNSLVNDAPPNGDWMTQGALFFSQATSNGPWYMGKAAVAWMPTAWVMSGFAVWIGCWGWY